MKSHYYLPIICTFFSLSFNASSQVTLFTQGFNAAGTTTGWLNTNLSTGGDVSIGGGGPDSAKWTLRPFAMMPVTAINIKIPFSAYTISLKSRARG